ncbi:MAG: SDR family oxidoreductase [Deltaproteobacteria bacterium]|nr:SDR family oxidoreductase [Deltaproteobacteria bacterium]
MSDFSFSSTAEEVTEGLDLSGKTVLVTGCNSGIGQETARVLGLRGAHVIGLARTEARAREALEGAGVAGTPIACELSEPSSVREAAAAVRALDRPIDALICNAGIMALPERTVKHGLELQFLTNHLGHFILVRALEDRLAADGRVVVVSSGAHFMAPEVGIELDDLSMAATYSAWPAYGQSKLANVLFARSLARRFEGSAKVACSLHPGVIRTNLGRNNPGETEAFFTTMDPAKVKSIPQGAATQCLLAVNPLGAGASGQYWSDCQPAKTSASAQDDALAEALWEKSEALAESLR